jgi:glutathione synthase/RimK-type ligase-like ATP-grasp enzyme
MSGASRRPDARPTIVLVTCRAWPELTASDALLAAELERRGCTVRALPWNDAPLEEFAAADAIVMRSNWDYHHELARFHNWLDAIESTAAVVHNPVDLMRSTLDKGSYLTRLAADGFRIARTLPVQLVDGDLEAPGDTPSVTIPDTGAIAAWADDHGFDRLVLKPTFGASGHEVDLVSRPELESACRDRAIQPSARPFLVQEFLPQIADGELSVVFFAGRFSHAYRRTPAQTDFRVNGGHGGTTSAEPQPEPEAIDFVAKVLGSLPVMPTFARVDVVGAGTGDLALMELEVNEPALGLHLAPGSASTFADAVLAESPSTS